MAVRSRPVARSLLRVDQTGTAEGGEVLTRGIHVVAAGQCEPGMVTGPLTVMCGAVTAARAKVEGHREARSRPSGRHSEGGYL
jgi:hypothetical protein